MGDYHLDGKLQVGGGVGWLDGFKEDLVDTHLSLGAEVSRDFGPVFLSYGFFPGMYPTYDFFTLDNELTLGFKPGVTIEVGAGYEHTFHTPDKKTVGRAYVDSGAYGFLEVGVPEFKLDFWGAHITPNIRFKGGDDNMLLLLGGAFGHKAIGSTNDETGLPLETLVKLDIGTQHQFAANFNYDDIDTFLMGVTLGFRYKFLDDKMFVQPNASLLTSYPMDDQSDQLLVGTRNGVALGVRAELPGNLMLSSSVSGNLQIMQESRTNYSVYESDLLFGAEIGVELLDGHENPDWLFALDSFANDGSFSWALSAGKYL